ncbi:hypothetical protein EDD11_002433 [Mortierella claussenii]|nr:hypothetical protein EDD11_002433 [Mortierella claussenii]
MDPWDVPVAETKPAWGTLHPGGNSDVAFEGNGLDAPSAVPNTSSDGFDDKLKSDIDGWGHKTSVDQQAHNGSHSEGPPTAPHVPLEQIAALEEVWLSFVEADRTRDLDEVKPALAHLCEAFKGQTWPELETKLREENCNTYLVASEDTVSFGYTLVNLRGEPNQQFRVIPSFIKPGTLKKGRLSIGMASSYEENRKRLEKAGVVRPSGIPRCHNCKQDGHIASACPEEKREPERSEYFGKCYNCSSDSHRTRNCPEPRKIVTCKNCNKEGHMARDCTEPPAPIVCNRCNEEGHTSRECEQPRMDITCNRCNQPGHIARSCTEPRADVTCYRCNQIGHVSRDCLESEQEAKCNRCNEPGHFARDCTLSLDEAICQNCNQVGHTLRGCPKLRPMTCRNCNQPGHMARDCDQPRQSSSAEYYRRDQIGHQASEYSNESVSGAGPSDRRPPHGARLGFNSGYF